MAALPVVTLDGAHNLVRGIEGTLGWPGPGPIGSEFAQGSADLATLSPLLSTPRLLDLIMRHQMDQPLVRCFRDGAAIDPDRFLRRVRVAGRPALVIDPDGMTEVFEEGMTIVCDSVHLWDPGLEVANRALQWWSLEPVVTNAYLTSQDSVGFGLHWDDHDVIVVQLEGQKVWEVREPTEIAPINRPLDAPVDSSSPVVWSGTLAPGGILHVPRGYWHRAWGVERGGHSLHLTFGITRRTGVNWLEMLATQGREIELFRRDLPRFADAATSADAVERLLDGLRTLAADRPPDAFLQGASLPDGRGARIAPRQVRADVVACAAPFPPRIAVTDTEVTVELADRTVTFDRQVESVLRALVSGLPVSLGALTAAFDVDAGPVADALFDLRVLSPIYDDVPSGFSPDLITLA